MFLSRQKKILAKPQFLLILSAATVVKCIYRVVLESSTSSLYLRIGWPMVK